MSVKINIGIAYNGKNIQKSFSDLNALRKNADDANTRMQALGGQMKLVGGAMASAGKQMTRNLTAPIVGLGVAGVKLAMDFETSFGKIRGLVGVAASDIGELEDAARTLGPRFGVSAGEAAEALFFITSAGLRGSQAIEVLQASLTASAIGLGNTATVADLATSAMNAFGSDVLSATASVDVLTAAVRLGKLAPEELAGSIGTVLPVASAMGVTFNDVGAAFAAMSRTGTNAATASTQLGQILSGLLKPTAEAEKTLGELGLSSAELRKQLREKGLLSVLMTLTDRFGDNEEAAAKVFGNIRALRGVLDLMGSNVEDTIAIFGEMGDVLGITDEALLAVRDSAGFKLKVAMEELKGTLQDVGTTLLPLVKDIADSLKGLAERFNNMTEEQQKTIVKTLGVVAAVGPLLIVLGQLTIVLGGIATLIGTIGVLAFGLGIIAVLIGGAYFATRDLNHELSKTPSLARGGFESFETDNLKDLAGGVKSVGTEMGRAATSARLTGLAAHYAAGGFDFMARKTEEVAESTSEAAAGVDKLGDTTAASGPKVIRLTAAMQDMLKGLNQTHAAAGDSGAAIAQFSREMLAAGNITDATAAGAQKLAQTIRGNLDRALADANRRLDEARQKFTQYRDAIAGGITRGNTLSDAVTAQDDAIRNLADAQDAYNKAVADGDEEQIEATTKALEAAQAARQDFVGFLAVGAQTAEGFADQIDALRLAGGSLEVVQQIAQLGAKTGGRVVAELLAGGAEAIAQANTLVSAVEAAAARAGEGAAQQFFGAGVKSARQFVKAIEATIPELQSVLDVIAEMISKALGIRLDLDITGRGTQFIELPTTGPGAPTPAPSPFAGPFTTAKGAFEAPALGLGSLQFFADGGIVTSPMMGVVGEAGPEAIIPLDRLGGMGGDSYVTINVTGADPQAVVEALRRYTRANGPLGQVVNV
jgi:TP901 family phage tail tape measure protein